MKRLRFAISVALIGAAAIAQEPTRGRVDLYGDPLPDGAIARLGSARFRHPGAVHCVAFSSDGKLLAASSDDECMIRVWEQATGKLVKEWKLNRRERPPRLAFSPNGKVIYVLNEGKNGSSLRTLQLSATKDGDDLSTIPNVHGVIGAEALSHDEKNFLDWNLDQDRVIARYPRIEGRTEACGLTKQHGWLVAQRDLTHLSIWDVRRSRKLWSVPAKRDTAWANEAVDFSPDGTMVVIQAKAGPVEVFESSTGKSIAHFETGLDLVVASMQISPDNMTLAVSCWDGSLRLYDLIQKKERNRVDYVQGWITDVFFAPDSKTFATGRGNNPHSVMLWDTATAKPIEPFVGHTSPISRVVVSNDGKTVVSGSWMRGDQYIMLWDASTGRWTRTIRVDTPGVYTFAISTDGNLLATCHWFKGRVQLWDLKTGNQIHRFDNQEREYTAVAFSPDGTRLATGYDTQQGRICLWDVANKRKIVEFKASEQMIRQLAFTRDGKRLIVGAADVSIRVTATGEPIGAPFSRRKNWDLVLSNDGQTLVTRGDDSVVEIWESKPDRNVLRETLREHVSAIAIAPDNRTLACGLGSEVALYDLPSGRWRKRFKTDDSSSHGLAFSPDGSKLISAGRETSTALIWDVSKIVHHIEPITEADLKAWWAQLAVSGSVQSAPAFRRFETYKAQTLAYLGETLKPVPHLDQGKIKLRIEELGSGEFAKREAAERSLSELGESALPRLQLALERSDLAPEQITRLKRIVGHWTGDTVSPETIRNVRAVAILESIGGDEARAILKKLAEGEPTASLTKSAGLALKRMKP